MPWFGQSAVVDRSIDHKKNQTEGREDGKDAAGWSIGGRSIASF